MVSEPVFECVGRHSNVLLCRLIFCGCHFSFVDHAVSHASTRDWAFILFSAITTAVVFFGGLVCFLFEDSVVMFVDERFYVVHTAVAYFEGVSVEDFVEFVGLREVLVD